MDNEPRDPRPPSLPEKHSSQLLNVVRRLYQQETLNKEAEYQALELTVRQRFKKFIRKCGFGDCLRNTLPARKWIPKYKIRDYLLSDFAAGLTNAVCQIPQGMGNSLLAHSHPIMGLYMAFFPVLIYVFLGTSPHASLGTFAVACLMTGNVVMEHASVEDQSIVGKYTSSEVVSALSFMVGTILVIMWCLRLGAVSSLLSEPLVSGLTTGAAFHVCASQLKDLFGIKLCKLPPMFKVIYNIKETIEHLHEANPTAIIISVVACTILGIHNQLIKPWWRKRSRVQFPMELITVVAGTLVSRYMKLLETYRVPLVGLIPTGLPKPAVPPFDLFRHIIVESITLTMVTYTVTMSMGLTFAVREKYDIDANQELFAMGASNIFGSFFSCAPICAGLARSFIQYTAGCKTLLTSLISALLILLVLLWIGPFFELLPRCILSSIVVVSLKGLFMQIRDLRRFWQLSGLDAAVWLVTFLVTVIISVDIGLVASLLASMGQLFYRAQKPYTCLLGRVMDTDLYLDLKRYRAAHEIPGLKIFHYCGSLNFASKNLFRKKLFRKIGYMHSMEPIEDQNDPDDDDETYYVWDPNLGQKVHCVVIDASALSNVDASGIKALIAVQQDLAASKIVTLLAGPNSPVLEMIARFNLLEKEPLQMPTFPSTHDAVIFFLVNEAKRQSGTLTIEG